MVTGEEVLSKKALSEWEKAFKMPNKSKKSNSKRSTLKHKYKVIKKVKQHLKKKAKEEKKARKAGKKPKADKDPGIPSQWPFKEELMKDLEWQRQRIIAQDKAKKEQKKLKRVSFIHLYFRFDTIVNSCLGSFQ